MNQDFNNPNEAVRYNESKPRWGLVTFDSLLPMVEVLMYGCKKYKPYNWQKGLPTDEILESIIRHAFELQKGNLIDSESKLSHIGHLQCNLMFLDWMLKNKPEFDRLNLLTNENKDNNLQSGHTGRSEGDISQLTIPFGEMEEILSPI